MSNDMTTSRKLALAKAKAWIAKSATAPTGRLVFAIDATASRQETWDMASKLMGDMFAAALGLSVQLVYYRGTEECQASRWFADPFRLAETMSRIDCRTGGTQIGKVFGHVLKETKTAPVQAVVFVGDAFEEELDAMANDAAELGSRGCPCSMFQEGNDKDAEDAFREIARLTGGAWARFDAGCADRLRELLRTVAAYVLTGDTKLIARLRGCAGVPVSGPSHG